MLDFDKMDEKRVAVAKILNDSFDTINRMLNIMDGDIQKSKKSLEHILKILEKDGEND